VKEQQAYNVGVFHGVIPHIYFHDIWQTTVG